MSNLSDLYPSGGLAGTQYVFVQANGTDVENAIELQAAYDLAKTMSPTSTNRITIVTSPANYNFGSSDFTMDTQYIDLVSLDGNRSIVFNGENTINITANNVFVKGVDVLAKKFTIGNDLNFLIAENCTGGDLSFGGLGTASGTFTNCTGAWSSFGAEGTASGTFNNCQGGDFSFGGSNTASGTLSGKLYYCRMTQGTFATVSSGGRTVLCIDGNDDQNNQ